MKKHFRSCFLWTSLVIFFFLVSITIVGCGKNDTPVASLTTVHTEFGFVDGLMANGALIWKGIPYAKPPVGSLRWKAPVDPDAWTGIRNAKTSCSECTQGFTDQFWRSTPDKFIGSEDCLYLDIYRPVSNMGSRLPVYVWIHGGGNRLGSAKSYDARNLARQGNMVVVVIQYRMGTLGWLANPALRSSGTALDQSGNYGTLDTMKALAWVKNNIAAFGGDYANVTIGGQSAGGHNVMNLIISPLSNNFQRAIAISPALSNVMPLRAPAAGDTQSNKIIDWLLVDDGTCVDLAAAAVYRAGRTSIEIMTYLRSKTAIKILQATEGAGVNGMPTAFMDGVVLPTINWLDSINAGNFRKVPLIIGTTQYEFKDLMTLYGSLLKIIGVPSGAYSWNDLYDVLNGTLTFDQVLPTDLDKVAYEQAGLLKSRKWMAECQELATAIKANNPANMVYSYLFTWDGGGDPALENFRKIFGAAHAQDIPFWFNMSTDLWGYSFTSANEAGHKALQNAMSNYLSAFVNTGNPNPGGSSLPVWAQWSNTSGDPKFIKLDADLNQSQISMDSTDVTYAIVAAEKAAVLGSYPSLALLFSLLGI